MRSIISRIVEASFKSVQKKKLTNEKNIVSYIERHSSYKPPKIYFTFLNMKYTRVNGFPCYILKPHGKVSTKKVIYIHGGAFILEMTVFHWYFLRRLANKIRATIYVPIYPLSTKTHSSLNDSFEMFNTIYKNLLKITTSSNITLMGDSAGGNMALVMAQQLKILQLPKPGHVILFSPAVDFSIDESAGKKLADLDPVLPWQLIATCRDWYSHGDDLTKPIYSPLYGDSKDIGRISIFIGKHEGLYRQVAQYHKDLKRQKIPHDFFVEKEMFHVYVIFNMIEGRKALTKIAKIIKD